MFYPSTEQKDIYHYLLKRQNNNQISKVDVIAPAGSGKTTTILFLMDSLNDKKMVYLVFNTAMKKEIDQRLNFSTTAFEMIDKDNLDVYTFHGYMRNILTQKISDIGFDYNNGSITSHHMRKILLKNGIDSSSSNLSIVADSFNKYIHDFVKTTQTLKDFTLNEDNKPIANPNVIEALRPYLKEIKQIDIDAINNLPMKDQEDILKEVYDDFLNTVFNDNALNEAMPHDIYYKYVYYKYEDLDLFKDYEYVLVDEAQDIDPIIIALLDKSKINLIKFGDNFQQINRFRGTVNTLENLDNKKFSLTVSYRLTPYMGLLTEAFLKQESKKLGYKEESVPRIYGASKTQKHLKNLQVQTIKNEDFFDKLVSDLCSVKVEKSDIYIELQEQKAKIVNSIEKGKKTSFNKVISSFLKTKDYTEFYKGVLNNTSRYNHDEVTQGRNIEIMKMDKNSQLNRELFQIAKNYNFKLNNKEKRELLVTNSGTYGYLTRNNKKAIDSVYQLVQNIPHEKLSDIPLFNIKFNLSLSATFDDLTKHKIGSESPMIKALSSIGSKITDSISVWDNYQRLNSIEIPKKLLSKLIRDKDSCFQIVDIDLISIQGTKHSLSHYGVDGQDLKDIIENAIKTTKTKLTKLKIEKEEITVEDILEHTNLNSLSKLMPFDKFVRSQVSLEEIQGLGLNMLENYYKYSEIKEIAKYNPNINLVKDGAFYNIYCSTIHQAKGLEIDNVLLGNDIYRLDDEKDLEENRDEFKLAYVALTRTKETLALEEGSSLTDVLEEVKSNDYKRYYASDNVLLVEGLMSKDSTKLPYFEVYFKDEINLGIQKSNVIFMKNSTFPNYKDLSIIIDKKKNEFIDLVAKGTDYKDKLDENTKIQYFKPLDIKDEEFEDILKGWKVDLEFQKEELEIEANSMF